MILSDENRGYRPTIYSQEFMGTLLCYDFNSYKILDQDESLSGANENPFSVIFAHILLACQKSLHIYCKPFPKGSGVLI